MPLKFSPIIPAFALCLLAAGAAAQYDAPRPPGSVGYPPGQQGYPSPREYPSQGYPPQQGYPQGRSQYPGQYPGEVQSQPLPPPSGGRNTRQIVPPPGTDTMPPPPGAPKARAKGDSLKGEQPKQERGAAKQGAPSAPGSAPEAAEVPVDQAPVQRISNPTAVFSGLDKITGRIITFDVAIDETVQFGALQVTPRACYTRPPTEIQDTTAFVEVDEITLAGDIKRIFTGWMFANSPGLHGVEHPIYDVWIKDCKTTPPLVAKSGDKSGDKQ